MGGEGYGMLYDRHWWEGVVWYVLGIDGWGWGMGYRVVWSIGIDVIRGYGVVWCIWLCMYVIVGKSYISNNSKVSEKC